MRAAVLADIHSNYIALEQCILYAVSRNVDTFIFLGDYIGELPYPERTMELLYDLKDHYKCWFIKGNKEDYWLNYRAEGEKGWEYYNSTSGSMLYAYKSLSDEDLDFFGQMDIACEIKLNEAMTVTICHGSPYKVNEMLLPSDGRTINIMEEAKNPLILCGHSHIQNKIVHGEKTVLNPGSVGIPYFSDGKSQFMLLDVEGENCSEEFISFSYDVNRLIKEMHEVRLYDYAPYWSIVTEQVLKGSNISHGTVLSRAMELCKKENGQCQWPDIPEKFWAKAVNELYGI